MGTIALDTSRLGHGVHDVFAHHVVWDNHTCTAIRPGDDRTIGDLRRHRSAGVDVVTLNVCWDQVPNENAVRLLADFRHAIRSHPSEFLLVERAADVELAHSTARLGVCFNLEGGNCLYGQVSMVSLYYDLGVRWMLFAYNRNNALAGGCRDDDGGLTEFGRAVLAEMERVGMQVCCSHVGERSALEIMARATRPVIYSHSNPNAVFSHPRNISDDAIRACARTGGVVGINGVGMFLGDFDVKTATIVEHIDHAVQLVGAEHVGIGLDYAFPEDEVLAYVRAQYPEIDPAELARSIRIIEPERLPAIADALLARGYAPGAVGQIFGGNHARLAAAVWR